MPGSGLEWCYGAVGSTSEPAVLPAGMDCRRGMREAAGALVCTGRPRHATAGNLADITLTDPEIRRSGGSAHRSSLRAFSVAL